MSWQGFEKCELDVAKRRYAPNYVEKQKIPEFQHYSIKAVQYQTKVESCSLRENQAQISSEVDIVMCDVNR